MRWFGHIEGMDSKEFVKKCPSVVLAVQTGVVGHSEDRIKYLEESGTDE